MVAPPPRCEFYHNSLQLIYSFQFTSCAKRACRCPLWLIAFTSKRIHLICSQVPLRTRESWYAWLVGSFCLHACEAGFYLFIHSTIRLFCTDERNENRLRLRGTNFFRESIFRFDKHWGSLRHQKFISPFKWNFANACNFLIYLQAIENYMFARFFTFKRSCEDMFFFFWFLQITFYIPFATEARFKSFNYARNGRILFKLFFSCHDLPFCRPCWSSGVWVMNKCIRRHSHAKISIHKCIWHSPKFNLQLTNKMPTLSSPWK